MFWFHIIGVLVVFGSSCSQILLKTSANKTYSKRIYEYLNIRVMSAYSFFLLASFTNLYLLLFLPLSVFPILESFGYLFVAILGRLFLQEKLDKRKIMGLAIILAGIWIAFL